MAPAEPTRSRNKPAPVLPQLLTANVPVLIIVAHPDDEVVGAAIVLMKHRQNAQVLHVTDGAPRNLQDAHRAGCDTAEEYARVRRAESRSALATGGGAILLPSIGIPDQSAARCMVQLLKRIQDILHRSSPALVVTHAYEGGHPDHDAVAFATAHACRANGVPVIEMTGYFDDGSRLSTGRFCQSLTEETLYRLDPDEQRRKQQMFACFRTQKETLRAFGTANECYRIAPEYDYTHLPNGGRVLYDRYDWGFRSREWPPLVEAAFRELKQIGAMP